MSRRYRVREASWRDDLAPLMAVRRSVFIDEQQVPEAEEWDEHDRLCRHWLALTGKRDAVGTARLHPSGRVGRVAVLREHRGHGVGLLLMDAVIAEARTQALDRLVLHSQVHAEAFYRRLGFETCSEVFLEAGIAHVEMHLNLS